MKKIILLIFLIIVICIATVTIFYNGFSGIESIAIQKFDDQFDEGRTITDKDKIDTVTGILNRANHITNTTYKLAGKPKYKINLNYKDKNTEVLDILENFDKNTTLLVSSNGDYYKINENQTQKILDLLLN